MSVFNADDPVSHLGDFRVVGDHDDGLVKLPARHFQKTDDVVAGSGVQVSGRLVGQDNRGLAGKGSCDGHPLLLAAGELVGKAVKLLFQAEKLDYLQDEFPVRPPAVQGDGKNDVFPYALDGNQIIILEDKADLLAAENGGLFAV